jgi:hypothetical protein
MAAISVPTAWLTTRMKALWNGGNPRELGRLPWLEHGVQRRSVGVLRVMDVGGLRYSDRMPQFAA